MVQASSLTEVMASENRRSLRSRFQDWIFKWKVKDSGPFWKRLRPTRVTVGVLVFLLLSTGVRIVDPVWVEIPRVKTFDLYQKIKPREPIPQAIGEIGVAIVDIDERSLASVGQWPWSRVTIGNLITNIREAGALVLGFDIVFAELDRTSPAILVETLKGIDENTKNILKSFPPNEKAMIQAMNEMRVVVGQSGYHNKVSKEHVSPSNKTSVKGSIGGNVTPLLCTYKSMLGNVAEIEAAASGHGFFSLCPEVDGVVRRVPMVAMVDGEQSPRPALTVEMLRSAFGGNIILTKRDMAGMVSVMLQAPGGRRFEIPTDSRGRIFVHFARPDIHNTANNSGRLYVSAIDVLNRSITPDKLRNKMVLVGISATGLKDIRTTPIAPNLPGVEVHANILETIFAANTLEAKAKSEVIENLKLAAQKDGNSLNQQELIKAAQPELAKIRQSQFYLRYPNFANSAELTIMLMAGIAMLIFVPRVGPILTLVGLTTSTGILVWLSWFLYANKLVLVDISYPGAVTFIVFSILSFSNYSREAAEKKKVRNAFGMYLSPDLVNQLAENPAQLKLGGETKRMSFLFCDVRGFTSISETFKTNPIGLTQLVNRLLTPLTEAVLTQKGTIDKYMGDCIMAFWNAPLDDDQHSQHACISALKMFEELDNLNKVLANEAEKNGESYSPLNIGIGINTGECVVGNMGSEQRFDYSVLGDSVNLAARLEGQSKYYGVRIIIGEETAKEVDGKFAILPLDKIAVKGKLDAVSIFTVLGDAEYIHTPEFQELEKNHSLMLRAYLEQDWNYAETLCNTCRNLNRNNMSGFYDLYEDRITEYRNNPPTSNWDGIYIAITK